MALNPGLYVPQGQVGTGAAYVHEIDNSKYLEQLAYQNKQKRIDALKKQAEIQKTIEDIDYTKPSDPVMANQLLEEAKGIRDYFSNAYVQNKVNISDKTSEAGRRFEYAQDQLEANANRAAYAEKQKDKFDAAVGNKPLSTYRSDLVTLARKKWDAAKTIDQKYEALALMDLDKLQNVDAYKFFHDAAKSIEEDKDFVDQIKDGGVKVDQFRTLLQQKTGEKIKQLTTSPEWDYMEADWEAKKSAMENGKPKYPEYQTATFEEFAKNQMNSHAKTLESTYEQTHRDTNININNGGNGKNESLYTTYAPYDMPKKNPIPHDVADSGKVEGDKLVIQYGNNVSDFTGTGLDKNLSAYFDSNTKQLKVPLSMLYLFPAAGEGKTLPVKKKDKATGSEVNVVGTFFTIDGTEAKDKKPTMVMKDRWGNVWIQLEGEDEYVPIEAGGKIYTSNKNEVSKFQSAAQKNRIALKNALGKDWTNTYEEFGFGTDETEDAQ